MTQEEQEMLHDREEMKDDDSDGWVELRIQGLLPERRSNHCSFVVIEGDGDEYLYIHGGRDLKEGAIETMWRINLTKIHLLKDDPFAAVCWNRVDTYGSGPGRISHHTASVSSNNSVVFFGGLKGEDSCADIFCLNVGDLTWTKIDMPAGVSPRDDHAMAACSDGQFYTFGGFVNGSRVNELAQCTFQGEQFSAKVMDMGTGEQPCTRAGHSAVYSAESGAMIVFGGQDDDNNKLDDVWCFDVKSGAWKNVDCELKPKARSGHSAVAYKDKMYVFGGIFELTKELNDLSIFDIGSCAFTQASEDPFAGEECNKGQPMNQTEQLMMDENNSPTVKRNGTFAATSPTRTKKAAAGKMGAIMQPHNLSPPRRRKASPSKRANAAETAEKNEKEGLSSPTSISMQQSFIIKNADSSFDAYHTQMKRRTKATGFQMSDPAAQTMSENKFGMVPGRPTARDGHSANVDQYGYMYVFGGDRHQMPFNDLYMIKLE